MSAPAPSSLPPSSAAATGSSLRATRRMIVRVIAGVFVAAMVVRVLSGAGSDWVDPIRAIDNRPRSSGSVDQIKRALIVSIDGLRPDVLLRARTPHLRSLMERGSYTLWARTTEMSITLPSHTSMLTGVTPEYHRITWNYYIPSVFPDFPTIFELAHKAGYSTALCSGKTKFHELCRPGSVDFVDVFLDTGPRKVGPDLDTADAALSILRRHRPDVQFVHFGQVDETGHGIGWATPAQIAAVENADRALGMLLTALEQLGLTDQTLIIVSADHGGQGKVHGPNDPRSRHIPWICAGPGIRQNYDLTRHADLIVNTEDTFATACRLLRIKVPYKVDGKFVKEILAVGESETEKKPGDKKKTEPPGGEDRYEYRTFAPPPYKAEWERMEPGHR